MLLLSLLVIFSLMVLSGGIYFLNRQQQGEIHSASADRRALYLADAGIAEAMTAIRQTNPQTGNSYSGTIGSIGAPVYLADGVVWVQATKLPSDLTQLTSTGMAGSGRAAVQVVLEDLREAPLFPNVLNSREQLTLASDVAIDSYDSSVGTYLSQAVNNFGVHTYANQKGDVSSNKDIILNFNAHVFGDATPGPAHSVTLNNGSVVTGSTTPTSTPFAFPPVQVPSVPAGTPMSIATNGSGALPTGVHSFSTLSIGKAATLTVTGPATIVVDDFTGGKDARLVIDATVGPVTFFVRNSYTHTNGFEALPVSGSPMALAWLIEPAQGIVFPSAAKVRGAYYAPNADITFAANNEAWGSFAGNRVSMSSSMKFHYDQDLSKHWSAATGQNIDPLQVRSWQVVDVAPAFLKTDRRNPFAVLGVTKGNLSSPGSTYAWQ